MGSYYCRVRFSDGHNTTKSLSVFDAQLRRAFEDHLVAFGASSEGTKTVHAVAFVNAKRRHSQTGQRPSKDSHGSTPTYRKYYDSGATTSPGKNTFNRDTKALQMQPLATYLVLCNAAGIIDSYQ